MKSLRKPYISIFLASLILFVSCTNEEVINEKPPQTLDIQAFLDFEKAISNDFEKLGNEFRTNNILLTDEIAVREYLGLNENNFQNRSADFQNRSAENFYSINEKQELNLKQMLEEMISKETAREAMILLSNKFDQFAADENLSKPDKEFLLLNAIVIKEYLHFLNTNQDLLNSNSFASSSLTVLGLSDWWDCMRETGGKAIGRGIAGGFVTGVVAGGIAGAAGGTAVVPIIGTVVGGVGVAVVGGAVGAVRGAAVGAFFAAADCL